MRVVDEDILLRNVDLIVDPIHRHAIGSRQLRQGSLNDPHRCGLAVCVSRKCQDCLCKLLRNDKFVVDFIVSDAVHGASKHRLLAFNLSNRLCSLIRQPGEYRDLRMRHSVWNQDLLPFSVVGHGMGITDAQRRSIHRSAANHPQGRHVARRAPRGTPSPSDS